MNADLGLVFFDKNEEIKKWVGGPYPFTKALGGADTTVLRMGSTFETLGGIWFKHHIDTVFFELRNTVFLEIFQIYYRQCDEKSGLAMKIIM